MKDVGRRLALPDVLVFAGLCLAAWTASGALAGLHYPADDDLFRDMGAAQGLLDGSWLGDPVYLDEVRWYNPFVPALVAAISWTTGAPVAAVFAHGGVLLGLLAPLAFHALARAMFDRWVACAATFAYLFLATWELGSALNATYSPWLWPSNVAQTLFFLTLLGYLRSLRSPSWRRDTLVGLLLGITFLAHTAPFLMLCATIFLGSLRTAWLHGTWAGTRASLRRGLTIAGVSMVVSAPFWLPIWIAYGFDVRNWAPTAYREELLELGNLGKLAGHVVGVRLAVSGIGLVALLIASLSRREAAKPEDTWPAHLLFSWLIVASLFLSYDFVAQRFGARVIVSSYHYFIYVRAAEGMFFGLGAVALARGLAAAVHRWATPAWSSDRIWQAALAVALCVAAVALHPGYSSLSDYREYVTRSKWYGQAPVRALHRWMRAETSPRDVFFTYAPSDRLGSLHPLMLPAWLVAPAGRKVVALGAGYSNPYVDYAPREVALVRLWEALRLGHADEFLNLASQYHLKYVIYVDDNGTAPPSELAVSWLAQAYPPSSPETTGSVGPDASGPESEANSVRPIVAYEIRR
jgi:hypothetical protein